LKSGEVIKASHIIANADVAWTYEKLLPKRRPIIKHFNKLEPSCSGFVQLIGVKQHHTQLAHHNIFFSDDYRMEFDDIFKRKVAPADPTIYLCITSKTDADHAPPGYENWFTLINAPYLSEKFNWTQERQGYAKQIQDTLFQKLGKAEIAFGHIMTPQDLQATYGGNRGAIYGFSSNTKLAAFKRPSNRAPGIKRLYFASGSAHPGGGVPLVALSGLAAADCVTEDT
jgi:phytoene dehydrogenase-like protein